MSSPPDASVRPLEPELGGNNRGEGRNSRESSVVKRRPNIASQQGATKVGAVQSVKSQGRRYGKSTDGVDSGAERLEMEQGVVSGEKMANSASLSNVNGPTGANLYNASNLPKETWKQVEKYEADLRKNPKDVAALVGWGRLLVKVARDVIATHTSPESVKNVRHCMEKNLLHLERILLAVNEGKKKRICDKAEIVHCFFRKSSFASNKLEKK